MSQVIEFTNVGTTKLAGPREQIKFRAGPFCAALLIVIASICMLTSSWDDSPCRDEPEHVTSGFVCVTAQNYQLNCWHPPLVKDLAALPLLFMHLKSPLDGPNVQQHNRLAIDYFFYGAGNDAQAILRAARVPLMVLAAIFLLWYYKRIRGEYGDAAGLVALVMLSTSPTVLAHARFVTNDVAAAAAFFVCLTEFVQFLRKPSKTSLCVVGLVTGVAQLVKFSLVMLYPVYLILGVVWVTLASESSKLRRTLTTAARQLLKLAANLAVIALIGLCVVWATYQWHTANLPPEFQHKYNNVVFSTNFGVAAPVIIRLTEDHRCLRGLSWYFTGLCAQGLHWQIGHPKRIYLLGEFRKGGENPLYFPILLVSKEPAAFLLLLSLASLVGTGALISKISAGRTTLKGICREHFLLVSAVVFSIVYFATAIAGHLNLGIRHLLPVIPFLYMLSAVILCRRLSSSRGLGRKWLLAVVAALLCWGTISSLASWPGYLAYFNEFAGGKNNGGWIASGSNYDWDTDFLRLKTLLERQKITDARLIYSGAGNPYYYLGNLVRPLKLPDRPSAGQIIAIPLQEWQRIMADWKGEHQLVMLEGRWREQPRLYEPSQITWFCALKPVGKAGDSILLFRAP